MAYAEPSRRKTHRSRPSVVLTVLAVFALALPLAAAAHLLGEEAHLVDRPARTYLPPSQWPSQGQAAIVVGKGSPAVSPDQEPAPIASLAKVMTAYLTLERHPLAGAGDGFTVTVTAAQAEEVSEEAAEGQSVAWVEAGERLTERQLLEALLIPSGNNIARMLASKVAGDEESFVADMNAEARALGLDQTTYTDPSGFDEGTVSTAADQLRVFRRAMKFPAFRQIVQMERVTLPVAGTVENFNPLVADGYGGKTGSDSAAGGCLAFFTHAVSDGHRRTVVGVVMGQGQGSDTAALLGAAADAAKGLVASAVAGADGSPRTFRPRMENRIPARNTALPRLVG
jgi:D-alanyl-D-alanine carboxypeptidase (penicillin-binding protein 5/6)